MLALAVALWITVDHPPFEFLGRFQPATWEIDMLGAIGLPPTRVSPAGTVMEFKSEDADSVLEALKARFSPARGFTITKIPVVDAAGSVWFFHPKGTKGRFSWSDVAWKGGGIAFGCGEAGTYALDRIACPGAIIDRYFVPNTCLVVVNRKWLDSLSPLIR